MRQTQVGDQTYVNTDDLSDWIMVGHQDLLYGKEPTVAVFQEALAKSIREWGRDPKRKV